MLNNVAGCLDAALAELDHGHFTSLRFTDLNSNVPRCITDL